MKNTETIKSKRGPRTGVFVKLEEGTRARLIDIVADARKDKNKNHASYSRVIERALKVYFKSPEFQKESEITA